MKVKLTHYAKHRQSNNLFNDALNKFYFLQKKLTMHFIIYFFNTHSTSFYLLIDLTYSGVFYYIYIYIYIYTLRETNLKLTMPADCLHHWATTLYKTLNPFSFNDTLNTCFLQLCGVKTMGGNLMLPVYRIQLAEKYLLYCPVTPVLKHWLQW